MTRKGEDFGRELGYVYLAAIKAARDAPNHANTNLHQLGMKAVEAWLHQEDMQAWLKSAYPERQEASTFYSHEGLVVKQLRRAETLIRRIHGIRPWLNGIVEQERGRGKSGIGFSQVSEFLEKLDEYELGE